MSNLSFRAPDAAGPAAADQLVVVDRVSQLLTASELDPTALLSEIVRATATEMGMKASAVRLVDPGTGYLEIRAVYGLSDRFLEEGASTDTAGRFRRLIENDGIVKIADIREEPDEPFITAALREGIGALLAVGLYKGDEIMGALSVYATDIHDFSDSEVQALRVIANQASVALELARLHEERMEKEWLERELSLAANIQRAVLPTSMPTIPGFDIAGHSESWEEIGGDFFDFIELPQSNLGVALGDVSGKSLPAALLTFTVRTALRAHAEHEYAISEIVRRVNLALCRDTKSGQFATLFYGVLNVPNRVLTYVNAGHNPPLLFRGDRLFALTEGGAPVGLLESSRYSQSVVSFEPGDVLVIYSDGYSEITGYEEGTLEDERLVKVLRQHMDLGAAAMVESVEGTLADDLDQYHRDDRTLVVVKVG